MGWVLDTSTERGQALKADLKDCRFELEEAYEVASVANKEAILDSLVEIDQVLTGLANGTKTWDDFSYSDIETTGMGPHGAIINQREARDGGAAPFNTWATTPGTAVEDTSEPGDT